jgi:acyl-CoA dehydrogenase
MVPVIDYASFDTAIGLNWYEVDPDLQARIHTDCPAEDEAWAVETMHSFGALVGDRVARNADVIDAHPPELHRYDRWAADVNEIVHHPATLDSKRELWRAGYPSGFAAAEAQRGRLTPAVVLGGANYLLSQADTGLVCSLGMTSGVAGLVDSYAPPDVRDRLLAGLRADDLDSSTDGSMFLTERDGGSDLGHTVHCTARDIGDGRVLIDGEKWFCSNIDGAAIVLLARPEGAPEGSAGLGLYLVPRYLDDGSRNTISLRRLKPKLGTRSVPTGEVEFHGALGYALRPRRSGSETATGAVEAEIASTDAGGLQRMMEMVNGSRFGVAMMGLGIARRSFLEAAIWAHHRRAKGRPLVDLPLAREQLVDLLCELEAAFAIGFECGAASRFSDGVRLRRILVPAAKVRLCRLGVEAAGFAVEIHGGNGYCEDWGLTRQLRDAQCHPIWEGTDNICCLDVLRSIRQHRAHEAVFARIDAVIETAQSSPSPTTARTLDALTRARSGLERRIGEMATWDPDQAEAAASRITRALTDTTATALLLEQGLDQPRKSLVALRYARRHLLDGGLWDDRTAASAGRELLAYEPIDEATAAKVSA